MLGGPTHTCVCRLPCATQVRSEAGVLDCMESYLLGCKAHLAVVGSEHLTTAGNFVIGSVVLSLLRRVATPVMVVTSASKAAEGLRECAARVCFSPAPAPLIMMRAGRGRARPVQLA